MKTLIAIWFFSQVSFAGQKEQTKVDFNQLIDKSSRESVALNDKLSGHYKKPKDKEAIKTADAQKKSVVDFIDFEVRVGEDKTQTVGEAARPKRQYNSVTSEGREAVGL